MSELLIRVNTAYSMSVHALRLKPRFSLRFRCGFFPFDAWCISCNGSTAFGKISCHILPSSVSLANGLL
jgi:hypothetical protein